MSGKFTEYDIESIGSERWDERQRMRPGGDEAQAVGWFGVARERKRSHGGWAPVELLLAEGQRISGEGHACVELKGALAGVGCLLGRNGNVGATRLDTIQLIDQLIHLGRLGWVAGAVLQLFASVEEETTVVSACGEAGDCIRAPALGASEVIPPCLAEVEAVIEGWSGDGSVARIGGFESQLLVGGRFFRELTVEVGHETSRFRDQPRAGQADAIGDFLRLMKLAKTFLAGPGSDRYILCRDQAQGGEPLECGIDPTVHGDVGRSYRVGIGVEDRRWPVFDGVGRKPEAGRRRGCGQGGRVLSGGRVAGDVVGGQRTR